MAREPRHRRRSVCAAKKLKVLKPRKTMLFACGCYRLVWDQFSLEGVKDVVEKAEEKADPEDFAGRTPQLPPRSRRPHAVESRSLPPTVDLSLVTPKILPAHIAWLVRAALASQASTITRTSGKTASHKPTSFASFSVTRTNR